MAIEFNDNIHAKVNRPTDFRFGPFTSIAQANSIIPIAQRYHGLLFGVYTNPGNIATSDITFYYYWDGLADTDVKPLSGSKWSDIGADIYRNSRVLIGGTAFTDASARLEINGRVSQVGIGDNSYFGYQSGLSDNSNNRNTAFGYMALKSTVGAIDQPFLPGSENSSFGAYAGMANVSGRLNSFFGANAGAFNTEGASNSFFGARAGQSNIGSNNTAVGASSLSASGNSSFNTAIGSGSLNKNTSGNLNTAVGSSSLSNNTSGFSNVAIGHFALSQNTTGGNNVSIGNGAGSLTVPGNFNNAASNSIFIGVNAVPLNANDTNQLVIGYEAFGLGSNTTVIGNSSTVFGRWWGNLLLGTSTNSGDRLRVDGTVRLDSVTNATGDVVTIDANNVLRRRTTLQLITNQASVISGWNAAVRQRLEHTTAGVLEWVNV
jgi:hypothetical protein